MFSTTTKQVCKVTCTRKLKFKMKINIIATNERHPQLELVAESKEDEKEILKFIKTPLTALLSITFPREDVVRSVKIEINPRNP